MLTKFEVTNFKSFKEKFTFDFTNTSDYQFNTECVKNGITNKGMIYGANGSGKSNLGLAIFDVVSHLTDKNFKKAYYKNYLNGNNLKEELAEFSYTFKFGENKIEYSYGKSDTDTLVYENLIINDDQVIRLDRRNSNEAFINILGAENLNTDMGQSKISVINYVKNNTVRTANIINTVFDYFTDFIDNMLFVKTLMGNEIYYLGLEKFTGDIITDIVGHNNLRDFEKFLNDAGIECKLKTIKQNGRLDLFFVFNEKNMPFYDVASTGTQSLTLLYFWLQRLKENKQVSFVFIDEFDAFYHHELSETVVKQLNKIDAQVILTTHNTSIMSNDLLRPDCYFLMTKEKIKPLSQCTEKELRFAHNLEKIYRAEGFNV